MAAGLSSPETRRVAPQSQIHLTFDAEHPNRPHQRPDGPVDLLRILDDHAIKATFFIQGRWASAFPEIAARIASGGHTIGSHSNAHVRMTRLSDDGIAREVREAEERVEIATGCNPKPFFRCPYGDGHDDSRVVNLLSELGYRPFGWDIDPQDWNEDQGAADVVASVEAGLLAPRESPPVVLLHSWPSWTPSVVDQIATVAFEQGLRFAPLG